MLGDHLFGLYEKALPPELSWEERLRTAKELGFDFLEISIDEKDERLNRLDWTAAECRQFRRAMADSGLPVRSLCLSGHRRFPYGSADPAVRARAQEITEKAILFAAEFGIRVIQLAGYDVYYEPSTADSLRFFREGLAKAVETAATYEVMLAMEIMDTELLGSITRYKEWKRDLPSPWFQLYPDLGNLSAWGNDVAAELALGGSGIVAVHLKDTLAVAPGFEGKFKCVPFGSGCVDFPLCFRQLEQQGFRGPFLMEMWHDPASYGEQTVAVAKRFLEEQYALSQEVR